MRKLTWDVTIAALVFWVLMALFRGGGLTLVAFENTFFQMLIFAMIYEVVARKLFIAPTDWAYDTSRMFSGAMFMLGAGYALMRGVHIRADFLYRNWQPRTQALVDGALYLLFYFPAMLFFFWVSTERFFIEFLRPFRRVGLSDH